jgi:hypothetical protein
VVGEGRDPLEEGHGGLEGLGRVVVVVGRLADLDEQDVPLAAGAALGFLAPGGRRGLDERAGLLPVLGQLVLGAQRLGPLLDPGLDRRAVARAGPPEGLDRVLEVGDVTDRVAAVGARLALIGEGFALLVGELALLDGVDGNASVTRSRLSPSPGAPLGGGSVGLPRDRTQKKPGPSTGVEGLAYIWPTGSV